MFKLLEENKETLSQKICVLTNKLYNEANSVDMAHKEVMKWVEIRRTKLYFFYSNFFFLWNFLCNLSERFGLCLGYIL